MALSEDWSSGAIDSAKWYPLRKQWGGGNNGVVPENVFLAEDPTAGSGGEPRKVLVCRAHGDRYDGPVTGQSGKKDRVGGVLVSRRHFASGRFQVRMKIGGAPEPGGPVNPALPQGTVPAIWTYGFRIVKVAPELSDRPVAESPLYQPPLQEWGKGTAFFWSELDFPEFGKAGSFDRPMYNTFLNKRHDSLTFEKMPPVADGKWHTHTTEWRTALAPAPGLRDGQLTEGEGYWWVNDPAVPWHTFWGNPFKRLGPDSYAQCVGKSARHWVDGILVGENTKDVPSMEAQLNLGVWLPDWAGPADWSVSRVSFSDIKIWSHGDGGDVTGIASPRIEDNMPPPPEKP